MSSPALNNDLRFQQALDHHLAGRADAAEALYRAILADIPHHADAAHNLGVLALDRGDAAEALDLFRRALKGRPADPQFWLDYVDGLARSKFLEAAWQVLEQGSIAGLAGPAVDAMRAALTQQRPAQADASLAELLNARRFVEAEAIAFSMTLAMPEKFHGWVALATAAMMTGRNGEAVEAWDKAGEIFPRSALVHVQRGWCLSSLGRTDEAARSFRNALEIDGGSFEALGGLSVVLAQRNEDKAADAAFERALAIPAVSGAAYNDVGSALARLGRRTAAEALFRRGIAANPDLAAAYSNLGNLLCLKGETGEAERAFLKAIELQPNFAEAFANLANVYRLEFRLVEAERCCSRALELWPEFANGLQLRSTLSAYLSDFEQVVSASDRALVLDPSPETWESRLYNFSYHPDLSAEAIFEEFVRWGDRFPDPATDFSAHDRTPGRRLKIGYVSPDFRKHTSRFYFMPLMANHDHQAFETFAYSNVLAEDEHTQAFKGVFDQWRGIRELSAETVATMIREDGIDILVDCCNHMRDDRLDVFALKPAPIQVTWLGAAWTTGLKTVDYVLFDPYIAPEGTIAREEIVRLPHCFIAYRPPDHAVDVGPLPALRDGRVTFGYSGRTERLNHHTFRVWGEILRRVPGSRLILDYPPFADPPTQEHYRQLIARHGLDPDRVVMRSSANIFEGLNDVDILLDCFPHSGGTMLFDALWMGVPALTLKSRPPLGRIGTTLMTNLDMAGWVAETEEDYIEKAVAYAGDVQALAEIRATLRDRMRASPLMDEAGFAKGVEDAYQAMWVRWAGGDAASGARKALVPTASHEIATAPSAEDGARLGELYAQGRREELVAEAGSLVERFPAYAFGWTMRGIGLRELGFSGEAQVCHRTAIELTPTDAGPYSNLAGALEDLGLLSETLPLYEKALSLSPENGVVRFNLSVVLKKLNRFVESRDEGLAAIELIPTVAIAHQHLSTTLAYLSDYAGVVPLSDKALSLIADSREIWELRLYTFSYHPDLSAEAIFEEFVRWGDRFPDPATDFSAHDRTPGRRLKIGYVSPDFRKHTSRFYFMPLMANHDHQAFETYAYSNVLVEDEHTEAFKGVFDHWRGIRGLSDREVAELVRRDGVDILVDCCNHMRDDRLDVFALKPAPIQVTWLGAAWTTGLKTVDYVLFDPYIAPEGTIAREEIVRLPHCFIAYRPPETTAEVAPLPALRGGQVTFGYSGRTERLNHHTFRVWGEILRRVPGSRLILDYHPFADPPTQEHYRQLMARHGLDPDRVEMRRSPNIFEGLGDIDILLDCFPHSGGTMLFDALWMGVPALTLKARPPLGRIGATLMTNLGMTDWVAETEEDYIDKALAFAADIPALAKIRAGLRERMKASPLMDEQGFAKGVEDAYQAMWRRWAG